MREHLLIRNKRLIFFSTLLLICIFNARPAIVGQKLGGGFFLLALLVFAVTLLYNSNIRIGNKVLKTYLLYILFYMYTLFQSFILDLNNIQDILSSFLLISIGMFGFIIFKIYVLREAIKTLSIIYIVFSISYIITYLFLFISNPLHLTDIVLQMSSDTSYIYPVYFPFSIAYDGTVKVLSYALPRAIANYREPGLLQLIILFLYWSNYYLRVNNYKLLNIFLFILLVLTFSTAGFICFGATILIHYFYKESINLKRFFVPAVLIAFLLLILFSSSSEFALGRKFENRSGLIRLEAAFVSYNLIVENPFFGIGFYESYKNIPIGINFLGTIAQLGIIGTILILMPLLYTTYIVIKYKKQYLILVIPLALTLFFSQPLYDKAITIFILSFTVYLAEHDSQNIHSNTILQSRYILRRYHSVGPKSELSKS